MPPLFDPRGLEDLRQRHQQWHQRHGTAPRRQKTFSTLSGQPVEGVYTPLDIADLDYPRDMGLPGEYPFLRGVHPTGYRGRLWTMRLFSGYGSAEETNARFKYLLEHGETGLSVAFDLPTLVGYDTDHPAARGEFGKCGVAVSSLADMEALLADIPVDQVTTSMTINGPAAVIWAMYIAAAEKRGIPMSSLGGTIQNDPLKEYVAQNTYIYPPRSALRLFVDTIEFGGTHLPKWNTVSISGYHIREAGATATQELAFTLADGLTYVDAARERGLKVEEFAPRFSFFFNVHNDFFEEIAKFRAARRVWARELSRRYAVEDPRALWLRFHAQTAGCALTAQQPENNAARVALQALAAVLGGAQSLHTNSMDEALALPSELAARVALRTQQIIAFESGVTNTVDPLGGSYYLEWLTNQMEKATHDYFARIEAWGGMLAAVEAGHIQREIAEASFRYQREVEAKRSIVVGVNEFVSEGPVSIPLLRMDPAGERHQRERLSRLRRERDNEAVSSRLQALEGAARGAENLMPYILEAVRTYATLGEVCDTLRGVFGEYRPLEVV
ncbi:MAG: methylmalonyl-CoA mutase family protein [Chloroflexi bacterium]|nr:methylmalonyl-CoA mutase family protein [Chloroflexota bacterium]